MRSTAPKVSVLILTYNSGSFLSEALDSVLAQDYPNVQLVVSDDASTDGTAELLREYAARYPGRIVLNLNRANLGITLNANKALALCDGEYVAFHAGDDVMLPNKIERQVRYLATHPKCVLCYHNLEIFDSASGRIVGTYNSWRRPAREGGTRELVRFGCFLGGNSVMARRAAIPDGGYDPRFPVASDWQLWIAITLAGGQVGYIDEVLARYRRHSGNTTGILSPLARQAILDALNTSNWVMVNRPDLISDALRSYAINLRLLRRLEGGRGYVGALVASLRTGFTFEAVGALVIFVATAGRVRP